jgi:hypothetical protein
MKTNDKRFDLAIKMNRWNLQTPKMQKEFHTKSIFDELELVMEITTSSRSSHG